MRLFVTTTFLIALIILCDRNIAQGALIKKDVSQHPIHITGGASTWQKDGMRIFSVGGAIPKKMLPSTSKIKPSGGSIVWVNLAICRGASSTYFC